MIVVRLQASARVASSTCPIRFLLPRPRLLTSAASDTCSLQLKTKRKNLVDKFLAKQQRSNERVSNKVMSAVSVPPPGYRANVGVCLVNKNNEVFVASRLDVPGSWQMPQGGVDKGEEPREAAFRELREETSVTSVEVLGETPEWLTYDFPPDVKAKITRLWGKEWTGQAQKWYLLLAVYILSLHAVTRFLFRFTGDESEIDLAGDGKEAAEFDEWKWLPVADVIKGAVEFKKPVYEQVFKVFSPLLDSKVETK